MDYIKRVTGVTSNELVSWLQDRDSTEGTATKLFSIT